MKIFALFTCTALNASAVQQQKQQAELSGGFFLVLVAANCLCCNLILLSSFTLHGYFVLLLHVTRFQDLSPYQIHVSVYSCAWSIHVWKDGGGESILYEEKVSRNLFGL